MSKQKTNPLMSDPRAQLPSADKILHDLAESPELGDWPHDLLLTAVRTVLGQARQLGPADTLPSRSQLAQQARDWLLAHQYGGLQPVVNATGIILHTGLGRAALPQEALLAVQALAGCCNLQLELETGHRGRRDAVIEKLLQLLTGAEAATVVNNNAAATLLALSALCAGREVVVSRGQLIEIGGSFRLPEVIATSGARLVEVGSTNKTHLRDYAQAITPDTAVLLHVHPSNFRMIGFTEQVALEQLHTLRQGHDPILVADLGAGALVDLKPFGLPHEPTVQECLRSGADLVLFSGDKLLSGPQAGIIAGRQVYVEQIRKHPLARALRVDKFTIAALEATLKLFLHPTSLFTRNPTLRMLTIPPPMLREKADALAQALAPCLACAVLAGESECGGGTLPGVTLPTWVVTLSHPRLTAQQLAQRLRTGNPSVIARIHEDRVCLDVRTLLEGDEQQILQAVEKLGVA